MQLYSYYRSTAAYRVRIALNIKGLDYEVIPVNLLKDDGEQFSAAYKAINPQSRVPTLIDGSHTLMQSPAILEYLEERYPERKLLPADPVVRAKLRAIANIIACDIHPLNNAGVLKYLKSDMKVTDEQKDAWYKHWVALGFTAIERMLQADPDVGRCVYGDEPTLADLVLIPQVYNAHRFHCSMDDYPTIARINEYCLSLPAFAEARPELQPDVPAVD